MNDTVYAEKDYQYDLGWGVDNRIAEPMITHGDNVENYTTNMFILPKRGQAIIVMYNACEYLVANGMANQLSYNTIYKLWGKKQRILATLHIYATIF